MKYQIPEQTAVNFFQSELKNSCPIHFKSLFKRLEMQYEDCRIYFTQYSTSNRYWFFKHFKMWFDIAQNGYVTLTKNPNSPHFFIREQAIVNFFVILLLKGSIHFDELVKCLKESNLTYRDYFSKFTSSEKLNFFRKLPNCFVVEEKGFITLPDNKKLDPSESFVKETNPEGNSKLEVFKSLPLLGEPEKADENIINSIENRQGADRGNVNEDSRCLPKPIKIDVTENVHSSHETLADVEETIQNLPEFKIGPPNVLPFTNSLFNVRCPAERNVISGTMCPERPLSSGKQNEKSTASKLKFSKLPDVLQNCDLQASSDEDNSSTTSITSETDYQNGHQLIASGGHREKIQDLKVDKAVQFFKGILEKYGKFIDKIHYTQFHLFLDRAPDEVKNRFEQYIPLKFFNKNSDVFLVECNYVSLVNNSSVFSGTPVTSNGSTEILFPPIKTKVPTSSNEGNKTNENNKGITNDDLKTFPIHEASGVFSANSSVRNPSGDVKVKYLSNQVVPVLSKTHMKMLARCLDVLEASTQRHDGKDPCYIINRVREKSWSLKYHYNFFSFSDKCSFFKLHPMIFNEISENRFGFKEDANRARSCLKLENTLSDVLSTVESQAIAFFVDLLRTHQGTSEWNDLLLHLVYAEGYVIHFFRKNYSGPKFLQFFMDHPEVFQVDESRRVRLKSNATPKTDCTSLQQIPGFVSRKKMIYRLLYVEHRILGT